MKPLNTLLSALLLSAVFSLTSVQADDATTAVNINNASIEQLEKIKGIIIPTLGKERQET